MSKPWGNGIAYELECTSEDEWCIAQVSMSKIRLCLDIVGKNVDFYIQIFETYMLILYGIPRR